MAAILLNNGMQALVDDKDFESLNKYKWTYHRDKRKHTGYVVRGVQLRDGSKRTIKIHRAILGLNYGDKRQGDHIDGNGLDNRRTNLRIVTSKQNQWNMRIPKNNTSGYKGVTYHAESGKWRARISFGNKQSESLGLFTSKENAALAWNKAALKYRGEYARLNRVERGAL